MKVIKERIFTFSLPFLLLLINLLGALKATGQLPYNRIVLYRVFYHNAGKEF